MTTSEALFPTMRRLAILNSLRAEPGHLQKLAAPCGGAQVAQVKTKIPLFRTGVPSNPVHIPSFRRPRAPHGYPGGPVR